MSVREDGDYGPRHLVRGWGMGFGCGGGLYEISNTQYWQLAMQGRLVRSLGWHVRKWAAEARANHEASLAHAGADAAAISFDQS